jgi:hypothetical protein
MRLGPSGLAWLFSCAAALAGPWPREAGTTFLSVSVESPSDGDTDQFYYSGYAEFGLTDWLTLGFDGGTDYYTSGEGYGFVKLPLPLSAGPHKFAVLAGYGMRKTSTSLLEPLYVLGGSWGMGFESALGPGWASIDGTLRERANTRSRLLKVDGTLGVNRSAGQLWFAQLRYADDDLAPDPTLELAPSVAWPLWGKTRLETSAAFGLVGSDSIRLKLGLWTEF